MLSILYIALVVFIFIKLIIALYEYQTYIRRSYMKLASSYEIDNSILNTHVVKDARASKPLVASPTILESQSGAEFTPMFELIQDAF